ncbi:MAG TPA: hypothetical protein DCZ10_11280 [Pelotomaculum sp.]|nr:hypothetical protein [Pelotomaculum sp.]
MSKLYGSHIQVELDVHEQPKRFRWLGRWHRVLNCAEHEAEQHWWSKIRTPEPVRYRCETYQGLVCDLVQNEEGWVLERMWD